MARDQQKFAALAQRYKSALGKRDRGDENSSEGADAIFQLGRQCAPGAIPPSAIDAGYRYICCRVIDNVKKEKIVR